MATTPLAGEVTAASVLLWVPVQVNPVSLTARCAPAPLAGTRSLHRPLAPSQPNTQTVPAPTTPSAQAYELPALPTVPLPQKRAPLSAGHMTGASLVVSFTASTMLLSLASAPASPPELEAPLELPPASLPLLVS